MPVASMAAVVMPHSFNHATRSSRSFVNASKERTLDWPGFTPWAGTQTKFCPEPTSMPAACKLICSNASIAAALSLETLADRPRLDWTGAAVLESVLGVRFWRCVSSQDVVIKELLSDAPVGLRAKSGC